MTVKDMCKLINELRPDVGISVFSIFGEGINDRAWHYSTIYDIKPPNFENMVTKDEEVSVVEVNKDEKLNVETVYVGFNINKKEEKMKSDNETGYFTITKAGMTLGKLLSVFKSDVFEIHFPEHEDLATGEVLQKILGADVLNSKVIDAHDEPYGDDFAGVSVTVDYNLDKEVKNDHRFWK